VHTLVGINKEGHPVPHIIGAISRTAQPGMRVTNTVKGAEPRRISLSAQEAYVFMLKTGNF